MMPFRVDAVGRIRRTYRFVLKAAQLSLFDPGFEHKHPRAAHGHFAIKPLDSPQALAYTAPQKEERMDKSKNAPGTTVYALDQWRVVSGIVTESGDGILGVRWNHVQYSPGTVTFNLHVATADRAEVERELARRQAALEAARAEREAAEPTKLRTEARALQRRATALASGRDPSWNDDGGWDVIYGLRAQARALFARASRR
jgi:hypothetical protein